MINNLHHTGPLTEKRQALYGHAGGVIWLTGLSAAGKSSLAVALEQALCARGYACYVLDGDTLRTGLNANLGFSPEDRQENVRRVAEVAALFAQAGMVCITAVISPYREARGYARQCYAQSFHEVHVAADLSSCEGRDPKGLYRKARTGELAHFSGVSAPYEIPLNPDLRIDTGRETLKDSLDTLLRYVLQHIPHTT
ncbi:adenylyl-sulfate kinase [Halopseudomonas sp.]|jgi:adenylylsulfate kinase|uniref:adenylyl-sulfate kinase n=1 Tax=Halopseudomonas sp. TaxID=2901191 RepID=UPI0039E5DFDE